jgi:pyruvate/2-oxoglutarate dehydrogenase complex dihydrolipoamide acyltransferase (E2) component
MVSVPTFQSNPYSSFDPSQWSNPYSPFPSQAIPWPSSYVGTPTDWSGNPIASYQAPQPAPAPAAAPAATPGTTLNSSPATQYLGQLAQVASNPVVGGGGFGGQNSMGNQQNITPQEMMTYNALLGQQQQQQPTAAAAAAAAPAAPNNSAAYLSALAHPNRVVTPGATVPQSPTSYQPGSGALQQFMAKFRPAASGPGAGFQQGFYNTLRGQGYG